MSNETVVDDYIIEVPLDNLRFELADRTEEDVKDVTALADNLKQMGQITPIVVVETEEDEVYRIIAGRRRFHAAQKASLPFLKAVVWEGEPKAETLAVISDNLYNKKSDPIRTAGLLQKLLEDGTFKNQTELGKAMGRTQSWVAKNLSLLQMDEDTQEAVQAGEVTATDVIAAGMEDRKEKKDNGKNPKEVISSKKDIQKELDEKKFYKLPEDCLQPIDGNPEAPAIKVDVFKEKIRIAVTFPFNELVDGVHSAISQEIERVGAEALEDAVRRFRNQMFQL